MFRLVVVVCALVLAARCQSEGSDKNVRQCIDTDALYKETFGAIESAVKISQYGRQADKLKELAILEKHVAQMRPIILAETKEEPEGLTDCLAVLESGQTANGLYTITPPGSSGPMEVYCDMVTDGGGWTVFQRRQDGSENFDRVRNDFNEGFGDRDGEFWLGNTALRNMTEGGGNFDVRFDMWDWDDEYRFAVYSGFAVVGDEFTLTFTDGSYSGTAGDSLSYHNGMGFTTRDYDVDGAAGGNCAEWLYGGWWYNFCHRANLNGRFKNRLDAVVCQRDQGIQWTEWKGFTYSLKKTEIKFRPSKMVEATYAEDCKHLMKSGTTISGVYTIAPLGMEPVEVTCDMETDGGGWTIFQRRESGLVDFEENFEGFARGFGDVSGDYWLGNYALRNMTDSKLGAFELRVDMWDWGMRHRFAEYQDFAVEGDDFTLIVGEYSGDAGDSLSYHNGMGFTTSDHDVDEAAEGNCAEWLYGGWWYNFCHQANLNGRFKNRIDAVNSQQNHGIQWAGWKGFKYSLKKTEMKFRPV